MKHDQHTTSHLQSTDGTKGTPQKCHDIFLFYFRVMQLQEFALQFAIWVIALQSGAKWIAVLECPDCNQANFFMPCLTMRGNRN